MRSFVGRLALALVTLGAVAACNTPAPSLRLELAGPGPQACSSTNCADVSMACETWISIRIIDPNDPSAPYLSQCQQVPQNRKKDMCSLAAVDLEAKALPVTDLEVQVAIYSKAEITNPITGEIACPADVEYDRTRGFPVEQAHTPAVGGRAYYHPGDSEVVVTLGCTNLGALNDVSCVGAGTLNVSATVQDFDTGALVGVALGDRLTVSVGEPRELGGVFVLNSADVRALDRTVVGPPPAWSADVDLGFVNVACFEVLEDGPQATTSVLCVPKPKPNNALAATAVRVSRTSLQQLLTALGFSQFPEEGMTIGVVLDDNVPLAGFTVTASTGTVEYLTADRTGVVPGVTSANGIFISTDAPWGTTFSTSGAGVPNLVATGGAIEGKVTIVLLQKTPLVGM